MEKSGQSLGPNRGLRGRSSHFLSLFLSYTPLPFLSINPALNLLSDKDTEAGRHPDHTAGAGRSLELNTHPSLIYTVPSPLGRVTPLFIHYFIHHSDAHVPTGPGLGALEGPGNHGASPAAVRETLR